jgi:hypothetical protein
LKHHKFEKAHLPETELWENLKKTFFYNTFDGIHAGNNQNSIGKPHSNFEFPEPRVKNKILDYNYISRKPSPSLTWQIFVYQRVCPTYGTVVLLLIFHGKRSSISGNAPLMIF